MELTLPTADGRTEEKKLNYDQMDQEFLALKAR